MWRTKWIHGCSGLKYPEGKYGVTIKGFGVGVIKILSKWVCDDLTDVGKFKVFLWSFDNFSLWNKTDTRQINRKENIQIYQYSNMGAMSEAHAQGKTSSDSWNLNAFLMGKRWRQFQSRKKVFLGQANGPRRTDPGQSCSGLCVSLDFNSSFQWYEFHRLWL